MIYDVLVRKGDEIVVQKESDEGLDERIIRKLCERPVREYHSPKRGFFYRITSRILRLRYKKVINGWEITIGQLYGNRGPYFGISLKSRDYLELIANNRKLFREKSQALDQVKHLESILRALDSKKSYDDGEWSRKMFFRG